MTQTAYKTEYDKLFIGGKWVAPSTSEVIEVHSPATGAYVGRLDVHSIDFENARAELGYVRPR